MCFNALLLVAARLLPTKQTHCILFLLAISTEKNEIGKAIHNMNACVRACVVSACHCSTHTWQSSHHSHRRQTDFLLVASFAF